MSNMRKHRDGTVTDLFAGCGGSSSGLRAAGWDVRLAANHNQVAVDSHSANFPDTDHLLADISNYDMRKLPWTQGLWASPECTWHSPAGGRKRLRAQLDLLEDYVPTDGGIRSRATAFDVIRAMEAREYDWVVVENVVEFADWPMFDWFLDGIRAVGPGYHVQIVCVSAAHIGAEDNAPAPQWRCRMFLVCTRTDVPVPDVRPRPWAFCPTCDQIVQAVQSWKRPDRRPVGKYRAQYLYRCPSTRCRHEIVEPFVRPAATAIDWSDLGTRIGDRDRPLAAATIRRIAAGLELFSEPSMITVNHGGDDPRALPVATAPFPVRTVKIGDGLAMPPFSVPSGGTWRTEPTSLHAPMPARTTSETDGLVCPPFLTVLRNHATAIPVTEPTATISAAGNHHGLTVPPGAFYVKNYGGHLDPRRAAKPVEQPLGTITTGGQHALVVPYRRARARTTAEPMHTLATKDSAALVAPAISVEDCSFRMFKPAEHLAAQRFEPDYIVRGNKSEQTLQAGNAVPCNVAQWLGRQIALALGR